MRDSLAHDNMIVMAGNNGGNPATHFGRQLRKERLAHGWSVHELASRTGITAGHISRLENGKRQPTATVAEALDKVFPERKGWFAEYHADSQAWTPPGFRVWSEYEDTATSLRVWAPGVIHGLGQTEGYARALLATMPGAADDVISTRLAARMERQRRVILRDDPPATWFVVDELSLYRAVGSPDIMAGQMERLAGLARLPHVTVTVLPAVAHPATLSELIIADGAAYAEHVAGGFVYSDESTTTTLARLFATIQAECYKASESLAQIDWMRETWATGASPLTAAPTADRAWR